MDKKKKKARRDTPDRKDRTAASQHLHGIVRCPAPTAPTPTAAAWRLPQIEILEQVFQTSLGGVALQLLVAPVLRSNNMEGTAPGITQPANMERRVRGLEAGIDTCAKGTGGGRGGAHLETLHSESHAVIEL